MHINFSLLFQACDELQIFCSTCSPGQLASLKLARVLPISAAQCGLITKSDAERLCSLLLHELPSQRSVSPSSPPPPPSSPAVSPPRGDPTSFKVQHKCFGDCIGVIHPQSYSAPGAKCIGRLALVILITHRNILRQWQNVGLKAQEIKRCL